VLHAMIQRLRKVIQEIGICEIDSANASNWRKYDSFFRRRSWIRKKAIECSKSF